MLEVDQVTRRFGDATVLDDVSFAVGRGRLTGFVGANGAGKTTTMRIILGVLAASHGEVLWEDAQITREHRSRFGYMPEERGLYPKQPVLEQLVFFGRLHGLDHGTSNRRAKELLERFELADRSGDKLESLSLGNQQRVQIAAALLHEPIALVLDEPFSGLDPLAVESMVDILREQARGGVPVLFSSHQLDLVERVCDDLVILSRGRVVAAGSVEQLRSAAGVVHEVELDADAGWVRDVPGLAVQDVDGPRALFEVVEAGADQELLRQAIRRGAVRSFTPLVPALSNVFKEVIQ